VQARGEQRRGNSGSHRGSAADRRLMNASGHEDAFNIDDPSLTLTQIDGYSRFGFPVVRRNGNRSKSSVECCRVTRILPRRVAAFGSAW
jgi:hypothetical protein